MAIVSIIVVNATDWSLIAFETRPARQIIPNLSWLLDHQSESVSLDSLAIFHRGGDGEFVAAFVFWVARVPFDVMEFNAVQDDKFIELLP